MLPHHETFSFFHFSYSWEYTYLRDVFIGPYIELNLLSLHFILITEENIILVLAFVILYYSAGSILWHGDEKVLNRAFNVYNPVILPDLDLDGTPDILLAHGGDDAFPHAVSTENPFCLFCMLYFLSNLTSQDSHLYNVNRVSC